MKSGPWPTQPRLLQEIEQWTSEFGLAVAGRLVLARSNVMVAANGDISRIAGHVGGLLCIGNHDKQLEFAPLLDFLAGIGRTDMKQVARFYAQNYIERLVGPAAASAVLPVYPRLLTRDRRLGLDYGLPYRLLLRRQLVASDEARTMNDQTLHQAAGELAAGGVVNIFPTGSFSSDIRQPWRAGVGRVLCELAEADREAVLVAPYRVSNLNRVRLTAAVVAQGRGWSGRPQQLDLNFSQLSTAAEVFAAIGDNAEASPQVVTSHLHRQYLNGFGLV